MQEKSFDFCICLPEIINYSYYFERGKQMSKDVINVNGEEKVVREDTAKSYRGTMWALLSVGAFIIIAAILLLGGFLRSATDDKPQQTPAEIETKRQ